WPEVPPGIIPAIARSTMGAVNIRLIQKRRLISASSGLGPEAAAALRGSSAMPQIGQGPGPARTTSGCMGHVYSTPAAGFGGGAGASDTREPPRYRPGDSRKSARHRGLQK